jgi:hypothetical protein
MLNIKEHMEVILPIERLSEKLIISTGPTRSSGIPT